MHELGYCEGVLDAVLRRAGDRRVQAVGVRIGAVHRVVPDAFQQSFTVAALGSVAADARTEVTVVPGRGRCLDCGADFPCVDPLPACARCGALEVAVEGGDELVLEWVAYGDATRDHDGGPVLEHGHGHERG